jgi:hypothetical protein
VTRPRAADDFPMIRARRRAPELDESALAETCRTASREQPGPTKPSTAH